MPQDPYLLVIADDHLMFRQGLKKNLEEKPFIKVIGEAANGLDLLRLVDNLTPHLVILDISMPKLRGIEAAARIKSVKPQIKILILSMHREREYLEQAISSGADGYLLKEDAFTELFEAIDTLMKGGSYFSSSAR
ncbi:MAG: hypothetical protein A2170_08290 [Deltaproteobacteria bacterium RBG_13_53_10]|nr:MAG: hypothetical protein A2170_08290 [Deltaproteobacteria bacterium RBG_13_53_10]